MTKLEMMVFMAEAMGEIFSMWPSPETYDRFARCANAAREEMDRRIGLVMRESDAEAVR
jgi:hypothetical protein